VTLRIDPLGYRSRLAGMSSSSIGIEAQPLVERVCRGELLGLHERHWLDCAGDVLAEREASS